MAALARAQAAEGVIPPAAAGAITEHARAELIDLDYAARQTRESSHSALGLIRALQAVLPADARDYVYVGATVQDITDTWTSLAIRQFGGIVWRDLRPIEDQLLSLAVAHRSTVMAGARPRPTGRPPELGAEAAAGGREKPPPPPPRPAPTPHPLL